MPIYYRSMQTIDGFSGKENDNLIEVFNTDAVFRDMEDETSDSIWIKVEKFGSGGWAQASWVNRAKLELLENYSPFSNFAEEDFVIECVARVWTFNAEPTNAPFFASADYLIALASIQSSLKADARRGPSNERMGVFGVTEQEWTEFRNTPAGGNYLPDDIDNPYSQISYAIYRMQRDAKALADKWRLEKQIGTTEDPYIARFGELLRCQLMGVDAVFSMQVKLKDGVQGEKLNEFLTSVGLGSDEADALMTDRKRFMRHGSNNDGDPFALKVYHDKCVEVLNKELKDAFSLIKKYVPEAVTLGSGDAPWMVFAVEEMNNKVNESNAQGEQRIAQYFQSTGFTQGTHRDKWCAAFVAWCMDQCGGDIRASYSGFKNVAAAAASWRSWGDTMIEIKNNPPVGAIVVLSPSDNTDEISHVGFFKEYHDEKRLATILGGNQSNEVNETDYKTGDIVGIRWLDTKNALHATELGAATDPKFAQLLTLIASKESGGNYNAFFGNSNNQTDPKFTEMSIRDVRAWQDAFVASGARSSAVGKYQIIRKTLDGLISKLSLDTSNLFDENMQDRLALQLLVGRQLDKYLSGVISRTKFGNFLAMEWASFPVLSAIQGKHRAVSRSLSYYAGDGLNRAHVDPADVEVALDILVA